MYQPDRTNTKDGSDISLYRTLELPGRNPLKQARAALDAAALDAYGFSIRAGSASDRSSSDLLKQLLDLNLSVASRIDRGEQVTAPGIPPNYADPKSLVTADCIEP